MSNTNHKEDIEDFNLLIDAIRYNYNYRSDEGFNICVNPEEEIQKYRESMEYNAITGNLPIRFKVDTIDRDSGDSKYEFDDIGMDIRYEHWENDPETSDYEDMGDFQQYEPHKKDPNHKERRIFG